MSRIDEYDLRNLSDDIRAEAAVLSFAALDADNGTPVPVELVLRVAMCLREYADLLDGDR